MEGAATALGMRQSNKGWPSPRLSPRSCWGGRGHGFGIMTVELAAKIHLLECGESCWQGNVSWKHFTAQSPDVQGAGSWWSLGATGCPDCRSLTLEKPPKCRSQLSKSMATSRQNSVLQCFPHTFHSKSLTASWQRKLYKGLKSIFTERAKRMKLELTGNELITSILCNLRKSRHCPVSPPKYIPAYSKWILLFLQISPCWHLSSQLVIFSWLPPFLLQAVS